MKCRITPGRLSCALGLLLWLAVVFIPLTAMFSQAVFSKGAVELDADFYRVLWRSFGLACLVGVAAVLLGILPGMLFGAGGKYDVLVLFLLLLPLVMPRYVLYFAWSLLLTPTTALGRMLSADTATARMVGAMTSVFVLMSWYWPLATLIIGQARRNIGRELIDDARLDLGKFGVFRRVMLPLLMPSILTAFGVCFVMVLSEFTTFHLAGIRTVGTELAVIYQMTGSEAGVVSACWPVILAAVIVAAVFAFKTRSWSLEASAPGDGASESQRLGWFVLIALLIISIVIPISLFFYNLEGLSVFTRLIQLHYDDILWSAGISSVCAIMSCLIAAAGLGIGGEGRLTRVFGFLVASTIFVMLFMPASMAAVSLLRVLSASDLTAGIRESWLIVPAGQAARFAAPALILLVFMRAQRDRRLTEAGEMDGADGFQIWWYIHFPRVWRVFAGVFIMIFMFSLTEISATMVLLPAGLPNFAQRLLNQMHYARDQQVIASCLVLISVFLALAFAFVLLMRAVKTRCFLNVFIAAAVPFLFVGCAKDAGVNEPVEVLDYFGRSGKGPGEFAYPRALDISGNGLVYVCDKTGRIQRFSRSGEFVAGFEMPKTEKGLPTGISFGPDGSLYVADTHYHRVVVFDPKGEVLMKFGEFGTEDGCFIYPTDVAFGTNGLLYVSEYGGNDRVSVFDRRGRFRFSFGSAGSGRGEFSRPSAVCVDYERERVYVADACNHRIGVYDYDGRLLRYIGRLGTDRGELRYPYDMDLLDDGRLIVCEYGNNRLQIFAPDGRSLGVYGGAGRDPGKLAYPWGLALGDEDQVYVIDSGNDRIQVWNIF